MIRGHAGSLGLVLGILGAAATAVAAPPPPSPADAPIISLQWENDVLTGRGIDRHYTNGIRISLLLPEDRGPGWVARAARAMPWFPEGGRVRGSWALGQNLYTPEDIRTPDLVTDDRPYAAWLYLGAGVVVENGRLLDIVELSLGVVGPAAQGEGVQKGIHALIGSPEPAGWSHQLPDEPAVQVMWHRKWRRRHGDARGFGVDVLPHLGGALGNVFIYGAAGGTARCGFGLPDDYGPPRIQPALPGSEYFQPARRLGGYLYLGAEGRVVLRNLFLDGSTFAASHRVDRRLLVADVQAGAALVFHGVRLAYTYVVRSEEFRGQDGYDAFGTATFSVHL